MCTSEVAVRRLVKVLGIEGADIKKLTHNFNLTRNLDTNEYKFIDRVAWAANNRSLCSMLAEETLDKAFEVLQYGK